MGWERECQKWGTAREPAEKRRARDSGEKQKFRRLRQGQHEVRAEIEMPEMGHSWAGTV